MELKAMLVNSSLTVILPGAEMITVNGADKELYFKVLGMEDADEIKRLLLPEVYKQKEKAEQKFEKEKIEYEQKTSKWPLLESTGEFLVSEGTVQMKGIPLSLPELLISRFSTVLESCFDGLTLLQLEECAEYQALKNFWRWCALCPNAESRNDLFKFLSRHDLRVNMNGFFFAYRRILYKGEGGDRALIEYISNQYLRVKTAKKGVANFYIYENTEKPGEYFRSKNPHPTQEPIPSRLIGNLKELHEKLPEMQTGKIYTDNYTQKMSIHIGREVAMPPSECDWRNSISCGKGLHVGNREFSFGGNGDTSILVLINPMNVIAIPHDDSNKMRVAAYFPVAVLAGGEEGKFLESADVTDLATEYLSHQMAKLQDMLSSGKIEEFQKHQVLPPTLDFHTFEDIVFNLDEKAFAIAGRVIEVGSPATVVENES